MKSYILLIFTVVFFSSCKKEEVTATDQTPLVMAHGFLASGDTYANFLQYFASNGLSDDRIFAFDWNTLGTGDATGQLDDLIDKVLAQTGSEQVVLMGHSAGGGLGYSYLSDPERAAKVKSYIHIASGTYNTLPGPAGKKVRTLNLYSSGDRIASSGDIPGATNIRLKDADHYQVATGLESFIEVYRFLNDGRRPKIKEFTGTANILVSGKALSFGENIPSEGAVIEVYKVDNNTGERLSVVPTATFTADAEGNWGPFNAEQHSYYEFTVSGNRTVHYYREPFERNNHLVYLRTFPAPGSLTGTLLGTLPEDDGQSVQAIYLSSQACVAGRDSLNVNGFNLSLNKYTNPAKTAIALFLYDGGDNSTSGNTQGILSGFPFLNAIDYFIPAATPSTITYSFNGRVINARNWKSESEGVVVVQFD